MGLKMNIAKTKVMVVDNTPINVNNVLIENVPGYVYLGQHYSLKEKNQDQEIQRRIMAGWVAYAKHRDIFKSNLAICLKRQVYNSCVVPAMTYGAETWTLTKQAQNKLAAAQTKMERSMLNIYTTKIDGIVCPPNNISETVAGRLMKLAHRQRIASTTIKLISNLFYCPFYQF